VRYFAIAAVAVVLLLPASLIMMAFTASWTYKIDTVSFSETAQQQATDGPAPRIWIDTHIELKGMFGGTITSRAPFDITFHFGDEDQNFASVEFTQVTITYDDGTVDKAVDKLRLPIRAVARQHESYNSMAGGKVVKRTYMLIMGSISGVITRDQPFTLKLKGHFIDQDGTKVPFEIEKHYDVEREQGTQSWSEVMSSI
jgi:hypothetical protein